MDVRGKLEFIQQSEYDATDIEVELDGLSKKMSGYHVHIVIILLLKIYKRIKDTKIYYTSYIYFDF